MPHYKCVACRTRLEASPPPADAGVGSCPECGSPLEPVGDLSELFGFRHVVPATQPPAGEPLVGPFDEPIAAAVALPRTWPLQ